MSGIFQGKKEASGDHGGITSPSQEHSDTNVPELTCKEKSLDENPSDHDLAMEPSASQDMDIKGIMSRKGKGGGISKGKRRASTIRFGKGKGDENQAAKKSLGMIAEKTDAMLIHLEDKELEEDLAKNNK